MCCYYDLHPKLKLYSPFYFYQGGLSTEDWQPKYFLKYVIRFIVNINIMLINYHISLDYWSGPLFTSTVESEEPLFDE